MKSATIYGLHDPMSGELRYVGKTQNTLAMRIAQHRSNAMRKRNHFFNWIRSLSERGLSPVASVLETVKVGGDWQSAERGWIAHFRFFGVRLLNGTDGGEGTTGRDWTPSIEFRSKVAARMRNVRPTPENVAKRSASLKRFYSDPVEMEKRRALAREAGRSVKSRACAAARMKAIWADPARAEDMRRRMVGAKRRQAP